MKPIQQHKDPRITNISFDNFTGSISIITPISNDNDDDDETKDIMLSTSQTNAGVDLFKPNHHLALITQPILGARSRKKDKNNSLTNSRRSSYNDSPLLIKRTEKVQHERKHESFDSGVDFSLSTNSSAQYSQQQQYPIIHRPLSALNEDLNPDDRFHEQHIRISDQNHSIENRTKNQSNNISTEQSSKQQYRSLNELSLTRKQNKTSRKKSKLNTINEQIQSISQISTNSNNQTTSDLIRINNSQVKTKAITPLGHYPNQEQIRAHINRSVIDRQHPSYLLIPSQKHGIQHAPPSKFNNLPYRQQKQLDRINQDIHLPTFRLTKQILPSLYHGNVLDSRRKGIKINDIQKREDQTDNFLTSTPRRHYEHDQSNGRIFNRSKPTGFVIHNKNRIINRNSEFESEHSHQKSQLHPKKLIRMQNSRQKSPIESINNLLRTTQIQPMNINNFRSKNQIEKNTNHFFQTRSPTSWSIISDQDSLHNKSTHTYQLILIDEQQQQEQLLDGRHVIPTDNSRIPVYIDSSSQTSSQHTYPFTCTTDSNNINANSPRELSEHRSCSSFSSSSSLSSLDRFSPNERFPLPLGKVTIAMKEDDISTNYDSDDGWSDDSAELIYADEQYITQKKKIIPSSSSLSTHVISKQ